MSEIRAVLFDLDGTLADTALDLGAALNTLLRARGLPEQSMDEIRPVAGHGSAGLLALGAGIGCGHPDFAQWRQAYLDEYERCFDCDTVLFDGIAEVVSALAAQGVVWGIVTNKPHTFTERLLPKLGLPVPPAVVVSGDTCAEAKPSPLPMHHACAQIGIAPEHCLYVGDAERDMQAGRRAGMTTVLARWGYLAADDNPAEWPCDAAADCPADLLCLDGIRFQAAVRPSG